MRSLIVGEGRLAVALAEEFGRSGVETERRSGLSSLDWGRLRGAQRADQIILVPGSDLTAPVAELVDGPRWLVCSWARDPIDARARVAGSALLGEKAALERGGAVLRLSTVFGRGSDDNVTRLARLARRYHVVGGFEDGGMLVQPLHVDDLAALAGCHLQSPSSGCFDVAGPEVLPLGEVWQCVGEILGVRSRYRRLPPRLVRVLERLATGSREPIDWRTGRLPIDIQPVRALFDWHPLPFGIRIEQGVHEAVE